MYESMVHIVDEDNKSCSRVLLQSNNDYNT